MRFIRTVAVLIPVVLAGALPAMAAEPAPDDATRMSPTVSAPAQPAEIPWLMPEPTPTAGEKRGPCTVSVTCRSGAVIGCSGQTVCQWQYDSNWIRGYVYCDGVRTDCPLLGAG